MKLRIGLGVPNVGMELAGSIDEAERVGFDSLWVSERVGAQTLDPIVAMTFIEAVQSSAHDADRLVDPEDFGVSITFAAGGIPRALEAAVAANDPGARAADLIARSPKKRAELKARGVVDDMAVRNTRRLQLATHSDAWRSQRRLRCRPVPLCAAVCRVESATP
jgi:hypothetical protein